VPQVNMVNSICYHHERLCVWQKCS
jgi:hypothetical protein